MPRLRSLAVLLLCALWVPATLHCDFEAAGLDELFSCAGDHPSSPVETGCGDACDVVENGWVKRASSDLAVAAPALAICLRSLALPERDRALAPPVDALTDTIVPPLECARTWQFAFRAAPPARAPSLAS